MALASEEREVAGLTAGALMLLAIVSELLGELPAERRIALLKRTARRLRDREDEPVSFRRRSRQRSAREASALFDEVLEELIG